MGFSQRAGYSGGHGEGITSSDAGAASIYVTDRSSRLLDIVDPEAKEIISRAQLASEPDYVRFVSSTNEAWVTEPGEERTRHSRYLRTEHLLRLTVDLFRY